MKTSAASRKRLLVGLAVVIAATTRIAGAEQLPLKTYTTADGLASDLVRCILSDSHGFLWFGTASGISRFDGYQFTNRTAADGLPGIDVRAIVEGGDGTYWAATNGGIFHWDPARSRTGPQGPPETIHLSPGQGDNVRAILEESPRSLLAATQDGLYRIWRVDLFQRVQRLTLESPERPETAAVSAICRDADGAVWVGTDGGLFRLSASGQSERFGETDGSPHSVRSLLRERSGGMWAGSHTEGIFEIRRAEKTGEPAVRRVFSRANGLAGDFVTSLLETSDGTIWAGTFPGLALVAPDRASARSYTAAEGLSGIGIWALAEDRNGNLWLGSDDGGVMRLARDGFRRFDARDGLASTCVNSFFESRDGQLCAFTRGTRPEEIAADRSFVECYDGTRFHAQQPRLQPGVSFGWGLSQLVFQDVRGEWWVPTIAGLYRFPAVPFERLQASVPRRIYTVRDGLPSNTLYRLFEDGRGDIWVGSVRDGPGLARWNRAKDSFRSFVGKDGLPAEAPMAFAEDRTGAVWIGFDSGLARFREGRMTFFGTADGVPSGGVHALLLDRDGRVWIASGAEGVARIDRPAEERPRLVRYRLAEGLSSDSTFSLTEDLQGRIYIATARGLDRLDPRDGLVQHFTTDDGLPHADIGASFRDRRGNLWFGSPQGLARLRPAPATQMPAPLIRVMGVFADGMRQPLPDLGATDVRLPDLQPGSAQVEIDFLAIDFAPGGRPRYQHFLEGIDREWTAPAEQRSIVYGRLPAGTYRFRVRSVANDGSVGQTPAEVRFRILPQLWRRPEILALLAAAVAGLAFLFHRSRLRSALAVERVRTRVATDLHDDIGAGLSEIAILSDLATQTGGGEPKALLSEIGESARLLVDSMSDIVWSTDPRRDDISSLAQRIRRFAGTMLERQGIAWSLEVPEQFEASPLDSEHRRQLFLIVKEALTNIARHAHCRRASVTIGRGAGKVSIEISDDGRGFSAIGEESRSGQGLGNMKARAASLGGEFAIESGPSGTRILVRAPLAAGSARSAW